jgi:hypothetical protein
MRITLQHREIIRHNEENISLIYSSVQPSLLYDFLLAVHEVRKMIIHRGNVHPSVRLSGSCTKHFMGI